MAADRGAYICQSQSTNLWMQTPTYDKLTAMHFFGWSKGLKTGIYYLRTKAKAAPPMAPAPVRIVHGPAADIAATFPSRTCISYVSRQQWASSAVYVVAAASGVSAPGCDVCQPFSCIVASRSHAGAIERGLRGQAERSDECAPM